MTLAGSLLESNLVQEREEECHFKGGRTREGKGGRVRVQNEQQQWPRQCGSSIALLFTDDPLRESEMCRRVVQNCAAGRLGHSDD